VATVEQSPGTLDLIFVRGDEFAFTLDFATNLSTYSSMTALTTFANSAGTQAFDLTVATTVGTVIVSLSETATLAHPAGVHQWAFKWDAAGGVRRTILSGTVTAR
jgi:hypothetical protein